MYVVLGIISCLRSLGRQAPSRFCQCMLCLESSLVWDLWDAKLHLGSVSVCVHGIISCLLYICTKNMYIFTYYNKLFYSLCFNYSSSKMWLAIMLLYQSVILMYMPRVATVLVNFSVCNQAGLKHLQKSLHSCDNETNQLHDLLFKVFVFSMY